MRNRIKSRIMPTAPVTADLLRELRGSLTQTEIARLTGIQQHKLSRWESGEVPAAADESLKLLELVKARRAAEAGRQTQ